MQRPVFAAGITAFLTMIIASALSLNAGIILAVFSLLVGAGVLFIRGFEYKKMVSLILLTAAFSCGLFVTHTVIRVYPALPLNEIEAEITGKIVEEPEIRDNGNVRYIIKTESVNIENAPQKQKLSLTINAAGDIYEYGGKISGKVKLYKIDGAAKASYYSRGIYLSGYFSVVTDYQPFTGRDFYSAAIAVRRGAVSVIEKYLPGEEGALLAGLTIGKALGIPKRIIEEFKIAGITHIIVVSGEQVSILGQLFLTLLVSVINRRRAALLTIFPVILFLGVTGFSYSVVRAGIMFIIYLLGIALRRQYDSLTSLGTAVLILLALNPFTALDLGFQLSASAALGIIVISPKITEFISGKFFKKPPARIPAFIIAVLSQTLSATLFTLPFIIVSVGSLSVISPLGNLLAALPAVMVIPLLIAGIAAHFTFLHFLSYPIFLAAGLICKLLAFLISLTAKIPGALVPASAGYITLWLGAVFILLSAAVIIYKGKIPVIRIALFSIILLLCGTLSARIFSSGVQTVRVLDLEKGFSAIASNGRQSIVIGAGGSSFDGLLLSRAVFEAGPRRNDILILPSAENEYTGGLSEISQKSNLIIHTGDIGLKSKLSSYGAALAEYGEMSASLWENSAAEVFPSSDGSFIRIRLENTVILINVRANSVTDLPAEFRTANLFITTAALPKELSLLKTNYALISGNDGNALKAVRRFADYGITAYATAGAGDITARTRGRGDLEIKRLN